MRARARAAFARLCAISLLVGLVPMGHAAAQVPAACTVPDQVVVELDGWTRIGAPQFRNDPQTLAAYAVDPVSPERMFATNGRDFARSTDGGCTWTEVFALPSDPVPGIGKLTIESIVVSPSVHDTVFVVIREDLPGTLPGTLVRARIMRSTDGGQRFPVESQGLLPGDPVELMVSESEPDAAYLATVVGLGVSTLLFATDDAGASLDRKSVV